MSHDEIPPEFLIASQSIMKPKLKPCFSPFGTEKCTCQVKCIWIDGGTMNCPDCNSQNWSAVEKNSEGVNVLVQCSDCFTIYMTRYNEFFNTEKPGFHNVKKEKIQ